MPKHASRMELAFRRRRTSATLNQRLSRLHDCGAAVQSDVIERWPQICILAIIPAASVVNMNEESPPRNALGSQIRQSGT